ncbi:MAG: dihydroneopterin aldolase [Thermoleophilia bacterium]|nr:dihydroneopterin aldolase [Thermoleophilia bacterium]
MPDRVTIVIAGLEVFGRHGVFPSERELGQRFVVDVELELLSCAGVETDHLADTVDYAALADEVAAIVAGPPCALLEHLAGRIAGRCLAEPTAAAVAVTVRKPHVALPHVLEHTAVRLRREREHAYWLGLGSNQGDRLANLQGLVDALRDGGVTVTGISRLYETAPREIADQPAFLNGAVRVRTVLAPREMLALAKSAERRMGRAGGGVRYGRRPADCDILAWDGGTWRDEVLEVPHPRLAERRFALLPLVDLDPDLAPGGGATVRDLAAAPEVAGQAAAGWPDGALG